MTQPVHLVLAVSFMFFNLVIFIKAAHETKYRQNAFGLTRPLFVIGAFVWGDVLVFAPFWILITATSLMMKSLDLFFVFTSLFWVVRSWGEVQYWLLQQFSTQNRNPISNLPLQSIFHNDSIWFVHQIFWQCVTVVSVLSSAYWLARWLPTVLA